MEIFHNLWNGAVFAISIGNILAIILGYVIGIIAGAIPGVMAVTAMVLILPYTFTLSPLFAISLLMGVYKGGAYAGSITATLFNIPGTPEAAATAIAEPHNDCAAEEPDQACCQHRKKQRHFDLLRNAPDRQRDRLSRLNHEQQSDNASGEAKSPGEQAREEAHDI